MKPAQIILVLALLGVATMLAGCLAAIPLAVEAASTGYTINQNQKYESDADLIAARQKITTKFNSNPDTDAWYDQRQKLAQSLGDRDFDKDFGRVFDSLTLAISTLEFRVNNMQRESGYLSATGLTLPPAEAKAMQKQAVNDWCKQNGFDATVLDRQFKTATYQQMGDMIDTSGMMAKYDKMEKGLTFQLVKLSDTQTRVKLRFSDVYYPDEVEAYYKLVWQAVDKQIFVDQTIEGTVEKRE